MIIKKIFVALWLFILISCNGSNVNNDNVSHISANDGKLYFRTFMWTGSYGSSLDISWIYLGDNGKIVRNPKNGVNPVDFEAEAKNNKTNVGQYKIEADKILIKWDTGEKVNWSLEYENGEISAIDGGIVIQPDAVPENYKLNGQFAASAILPNVSAVHTLVFSNDGTFHLSQQGAVSTPDVSFISKNENKGTYKISGNTLWLNFEDGHKEISTIYIWKQDGGKHHLVINQASYPQEN